MNNWRSIVVSAELSILEAMKIIDQAGTQFVMVLDSSDRLLGVVTDGDVRRGILQGLALTSSVSLIMNRQPRCLFDNVSRPEAINFLKEKHITHVPLINQDRVISGVISIDERVSLREGDLTAVLMVGGLGSRLGDRTMNCPKPMLEVSGRPVLEIIVENLKEHGFKNFIFCVNYKAEMISDYFGDGSKLNVKIRYVHEPKRMGTAGALGLIPSEIKGPFLIMNGDIITKVNFTRMIEFHREQESLATMGVRKYDFQIPFGVVKTDQNIIVEIEEKPLHSFTVSAGIYLLERDCFKHIPDNDFYDMPQLFNSMLQKGESTQAFLIHEYWLDIGREDDLLRAYAEYPELNKEN